MQDCDRSQTHMAKLKLGGQNALKKEEKPSNLTGSNVVQIVITQNVLIWREFDVMVRRLQWFDEKLCSHFWET